MVTKIKWILTIGFFCMIANNMSSCTPSFLVGCPESLYHFEMDAHIVPDRDTVGIGDTIWVEINSPVVFKDQMTNEEITFSDASNLGTAIPFVKLINRMPIKLENAVMDFSFDLVTGSELPTTNAEVFKDYLIPEVNGQYLFKLGIVPKDTGTFRFNLGNSVNVSRKRKPCPRADFYMRLVNTDQHYYLYPGGDTVKPAGADYYFYVK